MIRHLVGDRRDVDVYFCDPSSLWQRGSNENTNGLLRQYMPKSSEAKRVFDAMMPMQKIDVAKIEAARRG